MSLLNNSIGWANFQISGGPMRAAWVATAVAVFVPLLIFGTTQIEPDSTKKALEFWYMLLGILNGGILTLGLPGRVHGAMRRDRTSKLIESHRLMPTPAAHAIVGYLIGPNLLLMACAATIFVIGIVLGQVAGQDPRGWVAMHVAFAVVATTLSCLVAFSSQWLPRLNPALLLLVLGPLLSIGSFTIVPALRVMFGPFFARLPQIQAGDVDPRVIVGGLAQLMFAAILFIGACRRYRRDDVPALGFGWGFALLALWVAVTIYGILVKGDLDPFSIGTRGETSAFVVSVTLSMLLAIGPVASAAQTQLAWQERRRVDAHFDVRRPIRGAVATTLVLALLATLLLAAPKSIEATRKPTQAEISAAEKREAAAVAARPAGVPRPYVPPFTEVRTDHPTGGAELATVAGIIATFVVTVGVLAWAAGRVRVAVPAVLTFWIAVTWALPPIVDGARVLLLDQQDAEFPGPVGAASPPFGIGAVFSGDLRSAVAGLIAQAAMIPLMVGAWLVFRKTSGRTAPPPTAVANG